MSVACRIPHYELQGHTGCITALCFLEPWPLLASADSTGTVRIWSTKFAPNLSKLSYKQLLLMRNQASSGLWLMKELRAAKVQINARNTDGTLSDAQLKEAINREIRQSDIGTSRALVGSSNSVIVGGGAIRPDSAEPTSPEPGSPSAPSPAPTADLAHACAVTAFSFSSELKTLAWGDDVGRLVVWDLKPLLDVLPEPPVVSSGTRGNEEEEGESSRRPSPKVKTLAPSASATGQQSGVWLLTRLQGTTVRIQRVAGASRCDPLNHISEPAAYSRRRPIVWRAYGSMTARNATAHYDAAPSRPTRSRARCHFQSRRRRRRRLHPLRRRPLRPHQRRQAHRQRDLHDGR